MKKVLIFSHEWPPFLGGVGVVGYQLAGWLVSVGYEVDVVTRRQENISSLKGVNIKEVDTIPYFWFLSYCLYFRKYIDLDGYDYIFLNECAPVISSPFIMGGRDFKKCYPIVHGLEVENIYSNRISNFMRRMFFFKYFHSYACHKSRAVLFVGEFIKRKFLREFNFKHRFATGVFYAGVDPDVFFLRKSKINMQTKKLRIVSASRVTKMKGYQEKFEIIRSLLGSNCEIEWHVCGDGDYLEELKQEVGNNALNDSVVFHGRCSREKLSEIYSESDLYLLLSKYDEALPLSYVEAQMCGLFCVGFNRGGVAEAIEDNRTGKVVDNYEDAKDFIFSVYEDKTTIPNKELVASYARKFDMNLTLKELMGKLDENSFS